ncbi:unnamed protein product [Caenorhabditis auriculariae]|uniref:Uncharacterized protein n=1 Tax=Caenorhabditis auriculariae TaxID=2777116 RepID=A0A8S1H1A6_9PELO|nr:unnamed protein product [Caenorhabditis auriculariae]
MDAQLNIHQESWVFDEVVVQRNGQDIELYFEAPENRPSRDCGNQTVRLPERVVDRALAAHEQRIRYFLDTLKARTQHGGPLRKEAGTETDEAWPEEREKKEELEKELKKRDEELREKKIEVTKQLKPLNQFNNVIGWKRRRRRRRKPKNGRLTVNLAQTTLALGCSLAREEVLRQELQLLRARLAQAEEEKGRLAAQLQAAVQALDIPVEAELAAEIQPQEDEAEPLLRPEMDQASPRKRRRSSSSHSEGPSDKRSRGGESGEESPDVFRTPERGVEQARNGHDATPGQQEGEEGGEPELEEEDEVVPESDQEELAESSSSGTTSPAPSTPPRSPQPPATPPRTPPTPPAQPTRRVSFQRKMVINTE